MKGSEKENFGVRIYKCAKNSSVWVGIKVTQSPQRPDKQSNHQISICCVQLKQLLVEALMATDSE